MNIETAANPAGGEDTRVDASTESSAPASEAQTQAGGLDEQTNPNPSDDGSELEQLALANPEDEDEEVEFEGAKYKVPKPLKSALMKEADYRRKTAELAEQRRATEAEKAQVERMKSLSTDERRAYAKLESLHEQVTQYEAVDWDALETASPQEAQRHWRAYQTALNQRNTTAAALQQHEARRTHEAQQSAAKRREEVEAAAAKEIPNWPSRKGELETFATGIGYTPEALASATHHDFKMLHYAEIGARFIERQRAAAKAAAAGNIKPAPEVGGTAAAGSDPSRMSMDEYARWREANP